MHVYRITLEKWSGALVPSGVAGRWNSSGMNVIYTAENRSLACLENVVHRSGEGLNAMFRILVIDVPDTLKIVTLDSETLQKGWYRKSRCLSCRKAGDQWLRSFDSAVLRVPSAIIRQEFNYLLNPQHPSFEEIAIVRKEPFEFDQRIKWT